MPRSRAADGHAASPAPVIEGLIERRGEIGRPRPLLIRRLESADIDAVHGLNHQLQAGLADATLYRAFPREKYARLLAGNGRVCGAFCDGALIAYGITSLPGRSRRNMGIHLGFSPDLLDRVAQLESSGVDPAYRGHKLQGLILDFRIADARALGKPLVIGSVDPRNHASLANVLASPLPVRALKRRFAQRLWRYICHRDIGATLAPAQPERWLPMVDSRGQIGLFEAGWTGVALRGRGGEAELGFAPPA